MEKKLLVKLLAPEPSVLPLKCACLALLRIWELQSEEISVLKELESGSFGMVHLGRWKGQCGVLLRGSERAPCQMNSSRRPRPSVNFLLGNRGLVLTMRVCSW